MKKILAKNASIAGVGLVLRVGLKAIYFTLLARYLGSADYGLFAATIAIATIVQPFAVLGAGNLLVKYISRNESLFGQFWGAAVVNCLVGGIIAAAITFGLTTEVIKIGLPAKSVGLIILSELLLNRLTDLATWAFLAHQNYKEVVRLQSVSPAILLLFVTVLTLLDAGLGLSSWALLYSSAHFIASVYAMTMVRKKLGWGRPNLSFIKNDFREGLMFSLSASFQSAYNDIDKVFLSKFATLEITGAYSIAYRIINLLFIPTTALMSAAYPKFFKIGAKGIRDTSILAVKFTLVSTIYGLIVAIVLILSSGFLPHIIGSSYTLSATILSWLSPLVVIRALHVFSSDALTGSGFQHVRTGLQGVAVILNVVSCVILIKAYSWKGAVIATYISEVSLALFLFVAVFLKTKQEDKSVKKAGILLSHN